MHTLRPSKVTYHTVHPSPLAHTQLRCNRCRNPGRSLACWWDQACLHFQSLSPPPPTPILDFPLSLIWNSMFILAWGSAWGSVWWRAFRECLMTCVLMTWVFDDMSVWWAVLGTRDTSNSYFYSPCPHSCFFLHSRICILLIRGCLMTCVLMTWVFEDGNVWWVFDGKYSVRETRFFLKKKNTFFSIPPPVFPLLFSCLMSVWRCAVRGAIDTSTAAMSDA